MGRSRKLICGIDEAGRGAIAGPVVASAVVFPKNFRHPLIRDSKTISPSMREKLAKLIRKKAVAFALGYATVKEVSSLNILNATLLAMRRAFENLHVTPDEIVVDGLYYPLGIPEGKCVPHADATITAVSAASILAKVERDKLMTELQKLYPSFNFAAHKGYPTRRHLLELSMFGPTKVHRKCFKPVARLLR